MVNSSPFGDKILLYYKIVTPSTLNSVSGSEISNLPSQASPNPRLGMDSTHSEFMCTLVDSQNLLSASDFTGFLSHFLNLSKFNLFFKVLVPLDTYFPGSLSTDSLNKLSELGGRSRPTNMGKSHPSSYPSHNFLNQDTVDYSTSFNFSTALNIDFWKDKFGNLLGKNGDRKLPLVWVSLNPSDPIPSVDGSLYLKIYLFDKLSARDSHTTHSQSQSGFTDHSSPAVSTSHFKTSHPPPNFPPDFSNSSYCDSTHKSHSDPPCKSSSGSDLSPSDRDKITDAVSKWSLSPDGRLKDIRSLLSTLHNVLWDNVSWDPMPISLLVSDKNAIRPYYKKALLVCHPDKQGLASPSRKLLCELIIQTLMKSWTVSS